MTNAGFMDITKLHSSLYGETSELLKLSESIGIMFL